MKRNIIFILSLILFISCSDKGNHKSHPQQIQTEYEARFEEGNITLAVGDSKTSKVLLIIKERKGIHKAFKASDFQLYTSNNDIVDVTVSSLTEVSTTHGGSVSITDYQLEFVIAAKASGLAEVSLHLEDEILTSCKIHVEYIKPTSVTLDVESLTLRHPETKRLNVKVLPSNTTNKSVRWESGDESILSIDENGLIKTLKPGTTTVRVYAKEDEQINFSCNVTVLSPEFRGIDFYIDRNPLQENKNIQSYTIEMDDKATLEIEPVDSNITLSKINVVSEKGDVVDIKENEGKFELFGKSAGVSMIQIIAEDEYGSKVSRAFSLFVKELSPQLHWREDISSATYGPGRIVSMNAKISLELRSNIPLYVNSISIEQDYSNLTIGKMGVGKLLHKYETITYEANFEEIKNPVLRVEVFRNNKPYVIKINLSGLEKIRIEEY